MLKGSKLICNQTINGINRRSTKALNGTNRGHQSTTSSNGSTSSSNNNSQIIARKQNYFTNCHRAYSCIHCGAHLANHDELISKLFQGNHGRAYLFNKVSNIGCKQAVQRELLTGLHAVADIYCDNCETTVGWKYEQAFVPSQKYKEGKYIIELVHILKENNWDLTSYNIRSLLDEAKISITETLYLNNSYTKHDTHRHTQYNRKHTLESIEPYRFKRSNFLERSGVHRSEPSGRSSTNYHYSNNNASGIDLDDLLGNNNYSNSTSSDNQATQIHNNNLTQANGIVSYSNSNDGSQQEQSSDYRVIKIEPMIELKICNGDNLNSNGADLHQSNNVDCGDDNEATTVLIIGSNGNNNNSNSSDNNNSSNQPQA